MLFESGKTNDLDDESRDTTGIENTMSRMFENVDTSMEKRMPSFEAESNQNSKEYRYSFRYFFLGSQISSKSNVQNVQYSAKVHSSHKMKETSDKQSECK